MIAELLPTVLPWIIGGGLTSLLKVGDKTLAQRLAAMLRRKTTVTVPDPASPIAPGDWLSLLPSLLEKLAKRPPVDPGTPLTPATTPTNTQDLVNMVLDLLSKTEKIPPNTTITPALPQDPPPEVFDEADLVRCAIACAKAYPDHDFSVLITSKGVQVSKDERPKIEISVPGM